MAVENNLLRGAFPQNNCLRAETIEKAAASSALYVIFLIPRSGSTWLTELTMNTGRLGVPQEWFNDGWIYGDQPALGCRPPRIRGVFDINRYVEDIVAEGRGVAGLELSVFQAEMLCELMDRPLDLRTFKAFFYLRRQDIVAQAISLYRSVSTGVFHSYQQAEEAQRQPVERGYSFEDLLTWLRFLLDSERRMNRLFSAMGISPVSLVYEDLVADPLAVLGKISRHLDVLPPTQLPQTSLRIMRNDLSEEWRLRFLKELPSEWHESVDIEARAQAFSR